MISRPALLTLILVVTAATARAVAGDLALDDFAYAAPIITRGTSSAYRIRVPFAVYQNVAHQDLRDVRVFNARGEVVPYQLQEPQPKPTVHSVGPTLALFPLRGDARIKLNGLQIGIQSQGAALSVQTREGAAEPPPITGYLIDARQLTSPIAALQLNWPSDAPDFSGMLRIESSDDLMSWQTLRTDVPVLSLRANGAQLVQSRVEFPPTRAKFWRLTWMAKPAPFGLTSVMADTDVVAMQPQRMTHTVAGTFRDGKRREFWFDLGASVPINQLNIKLPEPNSVARLQLWSRARLTDNWREVTETDFFWVQHGASERRNEAISIATDFDRYWLARVTSPDGSAGDTAPKLQVSWEARDLAFLAKGSGPFLLAYGNGSAVEASSTLKGLLDGIAVQHAELGNPRFAGGPERLRAAPRFVPWKLAILWSTLSVGIILLGWMAYRLCREVSQANVPNH